MAVYERTYRGYAGTLTPEWSRFLVLSRYAMQKVFASRIFLLFFVGCYLPALFVLALIYLSHNLKVLEFLGIRASDLALVDAALFRNLLSFQGLFLGLVMALIVAPGLVSTERAHNALPLYLSRPLNRAEYVTGKLLVLFALLSAVTWVPGLFLFAVQSYLAGGAWLAEHLRIAVGIFVGSWIWIVMLSLISVAASASSERKASARIVLFGLFFILSFLSGAIEGGLGLRWGQNLNLFRVTDVLWAWLFGLPAEGWWPSVGSAWASVVVACALALAVLARRVRAYHVVR